MEHLRGDGWRGVWVNAFRGELRSEWFPPPAVKTLAEGTDGRHVPGSETVPAANAQSSRLGTPGEGYVQSLSALTSSRDTVTVT